MAFYVGQKVVCVDASGLVSGPTLKQDEIYTILQVLADGQGVALVETAPADDWFI